jgi:hypothetical protein
MVICFTSGIILIIMSVGRGRTIGFYLIIAAFFLLIIGLFAYSSNYKYFEDKNNYYYNNY